MLTEKLKADRAGVLRAAQILNCGGIVAIPTETVYGLAASALDDKAIKKVFEAKGRPQDNPLIVHISDLSMLYEIAKNIPKNALLCAEKFWPGPFTMILERTGKTAPSVSAGLETVAVRMPSHKIAAELIRTANLPLAAPSANISGKPSPTSAQHVEVDLDGKIDAIIFSDDCDVGVESTVVSFCSNHPRLLRPGAITAEQLRELMPNLVIDEAVLQELKADEKAESPGMKYKHYAPRTETFLVEGSTEQFARFVNSKKDCVAVCFDEEKEIINIPKIIYGTTKNELTLAHSVFSALREIDATNVKTAYIHAPSKSGVGLAVYNRLIRAAAFRVINL